MIKYFLVGFCFYPVCASSFVVEKTIRLGSSSPYVIPLPGEFDFDADSLERLRKRFRTESNSENSPRTEPFSVEMILKNDSLQRQKSFEFECESIPTPRDRSVSSAETISTPRDRSVSSAKTISTPRDRSVSSAETILTPRERSVIRSPIKIPVRISGVDFLRRLKEFQAKQQKL